MSWTLDGKWYIDDGEDVWVLEEGEWSWEEAEDPLNAPAPQDSGPRCGSGSEGYGPPTGVTDVVEYFSDGTPFSSSDYYARHF